MVFPNATALSIYKLHLLKCKFNKVPFYHHHQKNKKEDDLVTNTTVQTHHQRLQKLLVSQTAHTSGNPQMHELICVLSSRKGSMLMNHQKMISRKLTRLWMIHPGILFFTDTVKGLPTFLIFSIQRYLDWLGLEVFELFFMGFVISFSLSQPQVTPTDSRVPGNNVNNYFPSVLRQCYVIINTKHEHCDSSLSRAPQSGHIQPTHWWLMVKP